MQTPLITLRSEITRDDLGRLRRWAGDAEVVRYLNEQTDITLLLDELLSRDDVPVYAPLFNRDGRFFMLCGPDGAVGFSRLIPDGDETEIVLAIGDRSLWGHGLGTAAIRSALAKIFLELRAEKAVAYIHNQNLRSERAFCKNGFCPKQQRGQTGRFELTFPQYLNALGAQQTA